MSTKIYYAWKVPLTGLGEFIAKANSQMFNAVIESVRSFMAAISPEVVEKHIPDEYKSLSSKKLKRLDKEIRMAIIMRGARDAHYSLTKSLFDFECGITFRILGEHAYGFGWGNYPFMEAVKDIAPAVEYRYWNNTDRPEGVSDEEWRERGEIWDKLDAIEPCLKLTPVSFEPTNTNMEQQIWDRINPRTGHDDWNIFRADILGGPWPRIAVSAAVTEMKKHPVDPKVLEELENVLPRISLR